MLGQHGLFVHVDLNRKWVIFAVLSGSNGPHADQCCNCRAMWMLCKWGPKGPSWWPKTTNPPQELEVGGSRLPHLLVFSNIYFHVFLIEIIYILKEISWTCNLVSTWTCNSVATWTCNPVATWTCNPVATWTCNLVATWTCNLVATWTFSGNVKKKWEEEKRREGDQLRFYSRIIPNL